MLLVVSAITKNAKAALTCVYYQQIELLQLRNRLGYIYLYKPLFTLAFTNESKPLQGPVPSNIQGSLEYDYTDYISA